MGYQTTDPTCYVVDWPDAGVFKIGYSAQQRWRSFVLKGANIVALHPFPQSTGAFNLETYFENCAQMLYPGAFDEKTPEAQSLLGPDCGGYLECHRGDGHEFYALMLKHCSSGIAQIVERANRAGIATYGRNETNGLTKTRSHLPETTSSLVTRGRACGFSPLTNQQTGATR